MANRKSTKSIKIAVLGDAGVGKTCVTLRFVRNEFRLEHDPTLEDSFIKAVDIGGEILTVHVVDTAGQDEFKTLRDEWIRAAQAVLLVFSWDDTKSFSHLKNFWDTIAKSTEDHPIPILVAGNKCDLSEDQRTVGTHRGQEIIDKYNVPFIETSAKEDTNIYKAFETLVLMVENNITYASDKNDFESIRQYCIDNKNLKMGNNNNNNKNNKNDKNNNNSAGGCCTIL